MPEFWDIYLKKDRKRLQVWEIASNLPPNWSFWWKTNARKHVFLTRNFIFFALCLSVFPNKTCPGNSNIFRRQKLVRGIPTLSGEFLSGEFQPPCTSLKSWLRPCIDIGGLVVFWFSTAVKNVKRLLPICHNDYGALWD